MKYSRMPSKFNLLLFFFYPTEMSMIASLLYPIIKHTSFKLDISSKTHRHSQIQSVDLGLHTPFPPATVTPPLHTSPVHASHILSPLK